MTAVRGFWLLLAVAACGRFEFASVSSGTGDGGVGSDADAAPMLRLVYSDEFDDGDWQTNTTGMGTGFYAEGTAWHESDGAFHFDIGGGDYASTGMISHDAFPGMRARRIQWDYHPTAPAIFFDMGPEFTLELNAVALAAGNDNFNGELFWNTAGAIVANIETNYEDADHIEASLRIAVMDATKNVMCNFECTGMQDIAYGGWADLGALGTARIKITLDIDANGFRYSFDPPPVLEPGWTFGAAWIDMTVAAFAAMSPGFYVASYGGNNYVARAGGDIERIQLWEE